MSMNNKTSNKMKTMFKRFLVTFLTVMTLTTGMLSLVVLLFVPKHMFWIWIPCGFISYFVFEPVIANWRETYNNLLGVDDLFDDKK